jgi:hypothetical protein
MGSRSSFVVEKKTGREVQGSLVQAAKASAAQDPTLTVSYRLFGRSGRQNKRGEMAPMGVKAPAAMGLGFGGRPGARVILVGPAPFSFRTVTASP